MKDYNYKKTSIARPKDVALFSEHKTTIHSSVNSVQIAVLGVAVSRVLSAHHFLFALRQQLLFSPTAPLYII